MSTLSEKSTALSPGRSALRTFLIVIVAVVVYAYAVETTRINMEVPTEPRRQQQLFNVLRLLAHPAIFATDPATGAITGLSPTSHITLERILETIFMALMASTVGTALAVPLSFVAARNIMERVTLPLAAIMAAIVALPLGGWIGGQIGYRLFEYAAQVSVQPWLGLAVLLLLAGLVWIVMNVGRPVIEATEPTRREAAVASARLLLALLLSLFALGVLAHLFFQAGRWLQLELGRMEWGSNLAFVGNFIFVVSDFVRLATPALMVVFGALVAASYGSHYGQEAVLSLQRPWARLFTAVISVIGGAVFAFGIGSALAWIYLPDNPQNWTIWPAIIVGAIAGVTSLLLDPKRPFPIGFTLYTISRAALNMVRSVESLILAIVFVIWVGLGPFAGFLALTLHSIAALGKLFSEQVESIAGGPVEAITATGANRVQMIAYAVIPQIIPPYIAFAFYRWDINVRMSTIIGFVGGGGIGFVLAQNIQLLRYREASVMMLAIAIVVATLDYFSSRIRSQII
jgi:phosphonate ABC transporter permease subunit PhnE